MSGSKKPESKKDFSQKAVDTRGLIDAGKVTMSPKVLEYMEEHGSNVKILKR